MVEYEITEITDTKWIFDVVEVQRLAWGRDDYSLVPTTILRSMATHGGVIFGAITPEQQLIGYVFGFPALGKAQGKEKFIYHHSYQIGVLPAFQNAGVGTALKLRQKEYCQEMGFPALTWTYDPLVSANSHVNFKHLNTIARTYYTDYYGPRHDIYNSQLPTDRIEVEIWLIPSIESSLLSLKERIMNEFGDEERSFLWPFKDNPLPSPNAITIDPEKDFHFIPIPGDFLIAKKKDIEELLQWRLIIRNVYSQLIKENFVAVDFWRSANPSIASTLIWTKSPKLERLTPKFLQDR